MLKQSDVTVMSDTEVESSNRDKIHVDIEEPPASPRQIVVQQWAELGLDSGGVQDSSGVQDYTLMHDREPCRTTPLRRYGFEDLVTYVSLTNS